MAEPVLKPVATAPRAGTTSAGSLSERAIAQLEMMRQTLREAGPLSGNEALRLLREAFPDRPLSERTAALSTISQDRS